jgi:hypothetical protein
MDWLISDLLVAAFLKFGSDFANFLANQKLNS